MKYMTLDERWFQSLKARCFWLIYRPLVRNIYLMHRYFSRNTPVYLGYYSGEKFPD
jgi:uncharacterized protein with PQ loop repeat